MMSITFVFLTSGQFSLKVIPITKHRALSHINNPRVDKNDTIMYLAYENEEIVGYRVVMADKIYFDKQEFKIGWYSCVWVDPKKRGKGIAKELVNISLKDWGNKIVLVDPVPESKALYMQTGQFTDKIKLTGVRGYLRFNFSEILTKKIPSLKTFKPLLKILDYVFNIPNGLRIGLWKHFRKSNIQNIEYVESIDDDIKNLISDNNKNDLSRRNKAELDWIIKFPWILTSPDLDKYLEKYYFSSHSKQFITLNVKIFHKDKLSSFLMISIRDGHLKIPFLSIGNKSEIKKITEIIYFHLLKYNISTFTTFNPEIVEYIGKHRNPFIFTKNIKRQFLFSKVFENYFLTNKVYLQDGEGDTAFT